MRDERAGPPRVRIAVIGSSRVGKSALIVRYLTRRYIGEYHSNTDLLYKQTVPINGMPVELEVIDVSGSNTDKFPAEQIQWADACLLVYSVTDRSSFEYATEVLNTLKKNPPHGSPAHGAPSAAMPLALLGNKTDLDHLRQVPTKEGQAMSQAHGASFSEASVADNSGDLYRCVDRLLADVRLPQRTRKFSVTKMLGSLIGTTTNSSGTSRSGSVVACPRVPAPSRPPLAAAAP
ncbi:PREDICTED: ras-related and estrogen-regulated growth inhibitor-like protein [Papilio xuthus]|uniref:small monomeric GTPase n=1 Tax=Papilio xuthus TaxID=66420 RepID=A0A194PU38_PAPXU|nr:PREDICTED: ras-related and estrogen-regulated growth inhibitor-like protein [Papilio xuthus]KPI94650.1 Ras-like protein family member 11B [Papilio xuthus]